MESPNNELIKIIAELKSLPKKDRKAIERQLSGLDKVAMKNAFNIKALPSKEGKVEELDTTEENFDRPDLTSFSPWLSKRLSIFLEAEEKNIKPQGISQAVANMLTDCVHHANDSLEHISENNDGFEVSGFKSILSRLHRGDA